MEMDRRSFLSSVGGVAAVTFLDVGSPLATPVLDAAAYAQSGAIGGLNAGALRDRANADGEFLLKARYWDARLRLEIGDRPYDVVVQRGRIADITAASGAGTQDVRIAGPAAAWSS